MAGGTPYLFILLPVGFLLLFTYTPVVNMFWYSVTSWDGLSKEQNYVGMANYIRVFTRPEYFQVFYVSLFYFVASFAQLGIALYFATILSFQTKFKNFFKGVLFFPYLINVDEVGEEQHALEEVLELGLEAQDRREVERDP